MKQQKQSNAQIRREENIIKKKHKQIRVKNSDETLVYTNGQFVRLSKDSGLERELKKANSDDSMSAKYKKLI